MKQLLQPFCSHREDQRQLPAWKSDLSIRLNTLHSANMCGLILREKPACCSFKVAGKQAHRVLTHHCDFRDMQDLFV